MHTGGYQDSQLESIEESNIEIIHGYKYSSRGGPQNELRTNKSKISS